MSLGILLIGKNGQVGSDLAGLLPRLCKVVALDRTQLDVSKPDDVRRAIRDFRPRLIVNAAAYTAVDKAESDEAMAGAVNADFPGLLAEEARRIDAAVVHYSTDYIFDGLKSTPYDESDPPNPVSVYGKTKLAGEQAIRESGVPHLIFRTAWVYSARGRNFLLTVLRLASQREELRIVCDQIGAPTWSHEIACATTAVLEQLAEVDPDSFSLERVSGTYHMTASDHTTWYGFAQAILEEVSKAPAQLSWLTSAADGRPIVARRVVPITTAEYPTLARRPAYSVLSNALLGRTFGVQLSGWRIQLHSAFVSG
jgi:dTDP-4-dehydrorhamnose reductase